MFYFSIALVVCVSGMRGGGGVKGECSVCENKNLNGRWNWDCTERAKGAERRNRLKRVFLDSLDYFRNLIKLIFLCSLAERQENR